MSRSRSCSAAALATIAWMSTAAVPAAAQDLDARLDRILKGTPLVDGHNDWPEALRSQEGDARWTLSLDDLTHRERPYETDIARLRKGKVGAQFWSVWVDSALPGKDQVEQTLEQIDLVKQIAIRYPQTFVIARTAAEVRRAHAERKIASLIGVEGGGQIDGNLSVLRSYAAMGAGYLTLTHSRTIEWADSATDDPRHEGLTEFGRDVVKELNRLGVLVDLSHVSAATMRDALAVSKAPVIFSHSNARALDDHPRNVPDDVLRLVEANGGVVMVVFARPYVSDAYRLWAATSVAEKARLNTPPFGGIDIGQPDKAAADYARWLRENPPPRVTAAQVADHVEHIVKIAGIDHVGIGSDFDGAGGDLVDDLKDVSTYPLLFRELMRRGWSDADLAKLAGGNVLRAMEGAEGVKAQLAGSLPVVAARPTQ